jgi:hypothetical protein
MLWVLSHSSSTYLELVLLFDHRGSCVHIPQTLQRLRKYRGLRPDIVAAYTGMLAVHVL